MFNKVIDPTDANTDKDISVSEINKPSREYSPMPFPTSTDIAPDLGPYDFWCQIDINSGLFAITDFNGNRQWTGGLADVPPLVSLGRYNGLQVEEIGISFQDQARWKYFQEYVVLHKNNGASIHLDVVDNSVRSK